MRPVQLWRRAPSVIGRAVARILIWRGFENYGARTGEAWKAEGGVGLSGRGQLAPPHQLGVLSGERCKLSQRGPGAAPAAQAVSSIL